MLPLNALGPSGPSFDQPLEMLEACHDKIRRFCDQLEKLPAYVAEHGVNEAVINTVDAVVRYFDIAGPQHHQDEEDELFPLLWQKVPAALPRLEQLQAEHGYLLSRWQAIRDDLLALRNGDAGAISRIDIIDFVRLYREHAAMEEKWLFPLAAASLSEEEMLTAGQHMAARRQG